MKKEIVYPFFIECFKYTDDAFWKSIFEDLAYSITPYGVYVNKDFLTCGYKDKEFSYKIQKKDPKELYDEIYSIFKNKLGLMSRDEIIKKRIDLDNNMKDDIKKYTDWSNLKKKNIKDLLIEKYALTMKAKYSLTIAQTRTLVSIIFLAFIFKVIIADDITIINGNIERINGIDFQPGKILMTKDIYDINPNIYTDVIIDKKVMSDEWWKYTSSIKKNTLK
jgi:hypothetical protein